MSFQEIAVYRFGNLEPEAVSSLVEPLQEVFGCPVVLVERPVALPASAHYPLREQWFAKGLARALTAADQDAQHRLKLGVADVDLYMTGLGFVMSWSEAGCAVLSLTRLDDRFYGFEQMDPALHAARCASEAVHELGHAVGLRHCQDNNCVMWSSSNLHETDLKGWRLCHTCQGALRQRAGQPPRRPSSAGSGGCSSHSSQSQPAADPFAVEGWPAT